VGFAASECRKSQYELGKPLLPASMQGQTRLHQGIKRVGRVSNRNKIDCIDAVGSYRVKTGATNKTKKQRKQDWRGVSLGAGVHDGSLAGSVSGA